MLNLRAEHLLREEDIEYIDVFYGEVVRGLELCNPIDTRQERCRGLKTTASEASHSTWRSRLSRERFRCAISILKGSPLPPGKVGITTKNGQTFTKRVDVPYSHHHNPIKFEDLVAKFRDCLALAPRPISAQDTERVIDMILHLEDVSDIRDILRLLA